jgi:peptidoglycan/LPS O-acetylase OafA/YrhL
VDAFFMLSGFLVGGMIFRAGAAMAQPQVLAGFLLGRWMRTLPLYYFILIVRQALRVTVYGAPLQPWPALGSYALFLQNLAWPMPGYFIESWSLAVEEWFYLLLPLIVGAGGAGRSAQPWRFLAGRDCAAGRPHAFAPAGV